MNKSATPSHPSRPSREATVSAAPGSTSDQPTSANLAPGGRQGETGTPCPHQAPASTHHVAPGDFEQQLTEAISIQCLLHLDARATGRAGDRLREGRIQGLCFALLLITGEARLRDFCDRVGISVEEAGEAIAKETETFRS